MSGEEAEFGTAVLGGLNNDGVVYIADVRTKRQDKSRMKKVGEKWKNSNIIMGVRRMKGEKMYEKDFGNGNMSRRLSNG